MYLSLPLVRERSTQQIAAACGSTRRWVYLSLPVAEVVLTAVPLSLAVSTVDSSDSHFCSLFFFVGVFLFPSPIEVYSAIRPEGSRPDTHTSNAKPPDCCFSVAVTTAVFLYLCSVLDAYGSRSEDGRMNRIDYSEKYVDGAFEYR